MMPATHRPLGARKIVDKSRYDYERRGTRQEQGYTNAWLRESKLFLLANPLCVMCLARGLYVPSQCTDHIIPHRGDQTLFWDRTNWQALCNPCHNGPKRAIEAAADRAARRRAIGL